MLEAYLDIETTGLSWLHGEITVIGMYMVNDKNTRLVQLLGREATLNNLSDLLGNIDTIYTYNGSRFDLPFIHNTLGIDLTTVANHHDLMYDCWHCNLRGGLKAVERQLGIPRRLEGVSGWDAVILWRMYKKHGDLNALHRLLEYNREDVINLKTLRERLKNFP